MDIPTKLNQYINQDKYSQVKHNKFFDQELKLLLDQTIFNYYIHIIKNIKLNNTNDQNSYIMWVVDKVNTIDTNNPSNIIKARISMPDIDMDMPVTKRGQVIQYIKDRYGSDKVGQMITFQTMQGRGAMKDVLRAYGVSFDEMNKITALLPDPAKISDELAQMKKDQGESSIIRWALENDATLKPEKQKFREWCHMDEDGNLQGPFAKRFEQAIRLEGTKTAVGKHPAGIVIAPIPMNKMCPMVLDTKQKVPLAGLAMEDLEAIGGLKFDILGVAILDKVMGIMDILEFGDIQT